MSTSVYPDYNNNNSKNRLYVFISAYHPLSVSSMKLYKNQGRRTGEMTQSLKISLHKREDLSSSLWYPYNKPGMAAYTCDSSTEEEEARGPLELPGQPIELSQWAGSESGPISEAEWKVIEEDSQQHQPLASTCVHTRPPHTCVCKYMCAHARTHKLRKEKIGYAVNACWWFGKRLKKISSI